MKPSRHATVLFADVSGSTKLYELTGDRAAAGAIGRCLELLRKTTEAFGGRVVKTMGDGVMALFAGPDAAAAASAQMHVGAETLPAVGGSKLAFRIAFHAGPVLQRDADIFGDTVNLASRLVEQATKGQVLTSEDTAALLSPMLRSSTRKLYSVSLKGKAGEVMLCELLWNKSPDVTDLANTATGLRIRRGKLRLKYQGRDLVRRRGIESVTLGRDPGCDLVIASAKASRLHCAIERRQDKFVLKDHSTNGTYVTVEGEPEILLQREDFVLRKHGWISFGAPRAQVDDLLEYFFDES